MLHNVMGQLEFFLLVIFGQDLFECQLDHSIKSLSCSIWNGIRIRLHDSAKQKPPTIQWIAILPSRCIARHFLTLSCFQPQVTRWSYSRCTCWDDSGSQGIKFTLAFSWLLVEIFEFLFTVDILTNLFKCRKSGTWATNLEAMMGIYLSDGHHV